MTKYEFEELKNNYCKITEAIALYDSGNHSEYDEDDLNDQLDEIHAEICEAVSDIAQYLIDKIDDEDYGKKFQMTKNDLADIHYLNALYEMASNCRDYCYNPEAFGITNFYGNGVIDGVGADFYISRCRKGEHKCFGYTEFYQLLEEYELIID